MHNHFPRKNIQLISWLAFKNSEMNSTCFHVSYLLLIPKSQDPGLKFPSCLRDHAFSTTWVMCSRVWYWYWICFSFFLLNIFFYYFNIFSNKKTFLQENNHRHSIPRHNHTITGKKKFRQGHITFPFGLVSLGRTRQSIKGNIRTAVSWIFLAAKSQVDIPERGEKIIQPCRRRNTNKFRLSHLFIFNNCKLKLNDAFRWKCHVKIK